MEGSRKIWIFMLFEGCLRINGLVEGLKKIWVDEKIVKNFLN